MKQRRKSVNTKAATYATSIAKIGEFLLEHEELCITAFQEYLEYNQLHNEYFSSKQRTASTLFMYVLHRALVSDTYDMNKLLCNDDDGWMDLYLDVTIFTSSHKDYIIDKHDFNITDKELNVLLDELFTEIDDNVNDEESDEESDDDSDEDDSDYSISTLKDIIIEDDFFMLDVDVIKRSRNITSFGEYIDGASVDVKAVNKPSDNKKHNLFDKVSAIASVDSLIEDNEVDNERKAIDTIDSFSNGRTRLDINDYIKHGSEGVTKNRRRDDSSESKESNVLLEDINSKLDKLLTQPANNVEDTIETKVDKIYNILSLVNMTKLSKDDIKIIINLYTHGI